MESATKRQRIIYAIVSFFLSLIVIGILDSLKILTSFSILTGLVFCIVILVYFNPTWGYRLAKLWASWSVIGSRGVSSSSGVKLAQDIAKDKTDIYDNIDPRAARVVIVVIIITIIFLIVLAKLYT